MQGSRPEKIRAPNCVLSQQAETCAWLLRPPHLAGHLSIKGPGPPPLHPWKLCWAATRGLLREVEALAPGHKVLQGQN